MLIEAQSAGAEARNEGQSRECGFSIGDLKMRRCHFIVPAPSRKHRVLFLAVPVSYHAFFFDQKHVCLTRSTKDRKK